MTKEILEIITKNPGITYIDLMYRSNERPSEVWLILRRMQKEGMIKTVDLDGRKAKGWVKT